MTKLGADRGEPRERRWSSGWRGSGNRRRRTGSRRRCRSAAAGRRPVALGASSPPLEWVPPLASPRLSLTEAPPRDARPRRRRSTRPAGARSLVGVSSVSCLAVGAPGSAPGRSRHRRRRLRPAGWAPARGPPAEVQLGSARSKRRSARVDAVDARGRRGRGGRQSGRCRLRDRVAERVGPRERSAEHRRPQEAGQRDDRCDLRSHPQLPRLAVAERRSRDRPLPERRRLQRTHSPRGVQRRPPPPNLPLICNPSYLHRQRFSRAGCAR